MRKRKKSVVQKGAGVGGMGGMGVGGMGVGIGFMNGASNGNVSAASIGTLKKDFKKEALYIDPASWHGLQPVEYIHVDRETTVWYVAAGCGIPYNHVELSMELAWPMDQSADPVQNLAWRF